MSCFFALQDGCKVDFYPKPSIDLEDVDQASNRLTEEFPIGSASIFHGSVIHGCSVYDKRNVRLYGYGSTNLSLRDNSQVFMKHDADTDEEK